MRALVWSHPSLHTLACLGLGGVGLGGLVLLLPLAWSSLDPLSRGVVVGLLGVLVLALVAMGGFTWQARRADLKEAAANAQIASRPPVGAG